jgi:hypothetical protein
MCVPENPRGFGAKVQRCNDTIQENPRILGAIGDDNVSRKCTRFECNIEALFQVLDPDLSLYWTANVVLRFLAGTLVIVR